MPDLEEQLRRYGAALERRSAVASADDAMARAPRRRRWVLPAAGMVAAALVAVTIVLSRDGGRDQVTVTDVPDALGSELSGRTFVVVAIEEGGAPKPLAARPPVLSFDEHSVQVDTGCNGVLADYVLRAGELVVSGFTTTDMLCLGTLGAQELLVDALLDVGDQRTGQPPAARVDGGVLELRQGGRTAWAVETTDQDRVDWPDGPDAADAVRSFVQIVADEQWVDATYLWQGYADVHADARAAARAELEALARDRPWLARGEPQDSLTFGVLPSAGFTPRVIVTALSEPGDDRVRHAAAFVVSPGETRSVLRLPDPGADRFDVAPGSTVEPGQRITHPHVPVEGGAVAYVNGVSVPVDVDHETLTTSFVVPAWARGEIVVTMSSATPEEPAAYAAWYRVG